MLVRPEGVHVDPGRQRHSTVVSTSFLGGHGRVIARLDSDELVTVQVGNTTVTEFGPGDRVRLSPRGDKALALAP